MRKSDRLFRCAACKAEATFTPGPTGGGGLPRCDKCGGDLIRVPEPPIPPEKPQKIRLTKNLPIGTEHGALAGRVFDVVGTRNGKLFFKGDAGELCAAWSHEYEFVEEQP